MRVLTKEFFRYYESLGRDASELEDVRISLQRAKKEQDDVHSKLQCQQERLKSIRCSIEEEKKRIELTSSHWFYGTTTLQPQLWLRGGCKGKVERARKKIVKAQEEDIPNTAVEIETCQIQLPDLQKITKEKSDQFKVSSNATSERRAMKDQAVLEYPSINLSQLQQQESILGQKKYQGWKRRTHIGRGCFTARCRINKISIGQGSIKKGIKPYRPAQKQRK